MYHYDGRRRNARWGFSLLEALFTVLILAVLAAVAVPLYSNTKADAETKTCLANIRAMAGAESKYKFETGAYTTTGANLITYGLAEVPKCPKASTAYTLTLAGSVLTVACPDHAANTMSLQ